MGLNVEVKFPCGYELKIKVSGLGSYGKFDDRFFNECPLHGKNCPSKNKEMKK